MGRIFDDRGNRMSPSHSRKGGARYCYYISSALVQGQPASTWSVARMPAAKVEALIVDTVRAHIGGDAPADSAELISSYVNRIEVGRTEIAISLRRKEHASTDGEDSAPVLGGRPGANRPIGAIATSSFRKVPEQKFSRSAPTPGSSLSPRLRADGCGCLR
jgi:hypothetical protein